MQIGINGGGHARDLGVLRPQARNAERDGFASYWLSQITGPDALTSLAVIGAETTSITLGVSIVPIYGRHPLALAIQALTVQAATNGRLVLGIGVSHQVLVEGVMGLHYERPPGATDLRAAELCPSPEDAARTRSFLQNLARTREAA